MLTAVLLVAQIAALLIAIYAGRSKLRRLINGAQNAAPPAEPLADDLPDIDRAILRLLEERQGVVYQSEIVKELGLPKSTVHKALRRLSEAGYVEIQKRGRLNLVVLKRATSEASAT
ncbi:helix-turn-helix transcriptional regulator [Pyrobaculum neutrophilum]|uniref:Transcriptional regulator, TrmB n=1 Tax=Pyrobaculum neutrophilum (strain DSM 2338 / JCM 9278 / NBRC 100436 / V24Sta) TaxID=444157 RepID=B1YC01_PYRNV|nr:helix-turn-helix domain-containing protein [Pyrobaculum neutrophilum]ACB40855.1 transcriptional regulator, TrmB [Pyrobaculum neutrophilum V24Sta]